MGDASGLCAMMEPSGSGDEGPAAAAAAVVNNPMQVLDLEGESVAGHLIEQQTNGDDSIGKMGELTKKVTMEKEEEHGGGMAAGKEEKQQPTHLKKQQQQVGKVKKKRLPDFGQELTWEEKAVSVLDIVRRYQLTEYDPKSKEFTPTRVSFCFCNMAFFDHDKESKISPGSPIRTIPSSKFVMLEGSVNVIAIKVTESDSGYPISIFGTVLARDKQDYRCVYLFRRDRDHPQLITSPEDTLTLTGPKRGLATKGSMYFEFNLKIKGDGATDKDFSKGFIEHDAVAYEKPLKTLELESFMSRVAFIYTPVPYAVQATLAVNFLEGLSNFTGTVSAWTTGNVENEIILYDSRVEGTETTVRNDGRVTLTRNIVAVVCKHKLVLKVCVFEGGSEVACFKFVLGHRNEECTRKKGPYVLQVKVRWIGIIEHYNRKMWERIGRFGNILW
uniref:DUF6598 domain-containing protein n=2 Tax=Oryza TaxID=4527 RepID=A0A0E0IA68_ORYNI